MKELYYILNAHDGSTRSREYDHQYMVTFPFNRRRPSRLKRDFDKARRKVSKDNQEWCITDVIEVLKAEGWIFVDPIGVTVTF
jgi:hypothetical protein